MIDDSARKVGTVAGAALGFYLVKRGTPPLATFGGLALALLAVWLIAPHGFDLFGRADR